MEIIHFSIQEHAVFAVAAFPEAVSVPDEYNGVAFIKEFIRIAAGRRTMACRSMVADFNRNFKNLVRNTFVRARSHVSQGIRRCSIKANPVNRNTVQIFGIRQSITDRRITDSIQAVFAIACNILVTHAELGNKRRQFATGGFRAQSPNSLSL